MVYYEVDGDRVYLYKDNTGNERVVGQDLFTVKELLATVLKVNEMQIERTLKHGKNNT